MEQISNGFKILIGISFLSVLSDMLISEGSFQKYVRSILGIVMLLIIINTFAGVKQITFDFSWLDQIQQEDHLNIAVETDLYSDVKKRIEGNIAAELNTKDIETEDIDITLDKDYHMTSVVISLKNKQLEKQVAGILEEQFQIEPTILEFY